MAFTQKLIDVTFTLGEGTFGDGGANTTKLSGLRVSAKVTKAGGISMNQLDADIFGMTLSDMNKLSTLGMDVILTRHNSILLEAGDADSGMSTVFDGTITDAWVDGNAAPEVAFRVTGQTGLIDAVSRLAPSSYKGPVDVADIMASLATKMGRPFENNGVHVTLDSQYLWGSPRNQAAKAAVTANISWMIDDKSLAIWPRRQARGTGRRSRDRPIAALPARARR